MITIYILTINKKGVNAFIYETSFMVLKERKGLEVRKNKD